MGPNAAVYLIQKRCQSEGRLRKAKERLNFCTEALVIINGKKI